MIKYILFLTACFTLSTVSFAATWTEISPSEFHLPPPPKTDSAQFKEESRLLHEYQDTRTDKICAVARSMESPTFLNLFGNQPDLISNTDLKILEPFFSRIFDLAGKISYQFKVQYHRTRPFIEDKTLTPCVSKPSGQRSYPSGHSIAGYLGGCILKEIYPKKADQFMAEGKLIGHLRAVVGVHHDSDVKAGQDLGADICNRLLNEDSFQKELKEQILNLTSSSDNRT